MREIVLVMKVINIVGGTKHLACEPWKRQEWNWSISIRTWFEVIKTAIICSKDLDSPQPALLIFFLKLEFKFLFTFWQHRFHALKNHFSKQQSTPTATIAVNIRRNSEQSQVENHSGHFQNEDYGFSLWVNLHFLIFSFGDITKSISAHE